VDKFVGYRPESVWVSKRHRLQPCTVDTSASYCNWGNSTKQSRKYLLHMYLLILVQKVHYQQSTRLSQRSFSHTIHVKTEKQGHAHVRRPML